MKKKNLFFASLIGVAVVGSLSLVRLASEGMFNNSYDYDDDSLTADINWAIENLEAGTFSEENSEIDEELVHYNDEEVREAIKNYEEWNENDDDDEWNENDDDNSSKDVRAVILDLLNDAGKENSAKKVYIPKGMIDMNMNLGPVNGPPACTACNGHGEVSCYQCNGPGTKTCDLCKGAGYFSWNGESCHQCGGNGNRMCSVCQGRGVKKCRTCGGKGYK